jgi:hypothetical protein
MDSCEEPFPAAGNCPHPNDHALGERHPWVRYPRMSLLYVRAWIRDRRLGSIFHRWRRGLMISSDDFLYLRARALEAPLESRENGPMFLLVELVSQGLNALGAAFCRYYGVSREQMSAALRPALLYAVQRAEAPMYATASRRDDCWLIFLLLTVMCKLWLDLGLGCRDTSDLSESAFAALVEEEWERLQSFGTATETGAMRFHVIPAISIRDLVRFSGMRGARLPVRREVRVYLRSFAAPYHDYLRRWRENFPGDEFTERLPEVYSGMEALDTDAELGPKFADGLPVPPESAIPPPPLLWDACARCAFLHNCSDPFPPSGACPHPEQRIAGVLHPLVAEPLQADVYRDLLRQDLRLGSIFHRWRRGLPVSPGDFLAIRERAIQAPEGMVVPRPVVLVLDILYPQMERLCLDFVSYYGVPTKQFTPALHRGIILAVATANPYVLEGTLSQGYGADWIRHVVDVVRGWIWWDLKLGFLDTGALTDQQFREVFEREWEALQPYRGTLYDFRVIPKLAITDFVRYSELPRGKRIIRRSISTWMTHQERAYPHFSRPWVANFADLAFGRRIRQMYTPLVEMIADRVLENEGVRGARRPQMRSDVVRHVWEVYEFAWKRFQFYWNYPGRRRPFGFQGLVGFAESPEAQRLFNALVEDLGLDYRSTDLVEVGFALYISRNLYAWLQRHYPKERRRDRTVSLDQPAYAGDERGEGLNLAEMLDVDSGWDIDPDTLSPEEPEVTGPDGRRYYTIEQVARSFHFSVDQLRRMDRAGSYVPLRAKDVFKEASPLGHKTRLYPATEGLEHALRVAGLRAEMRASRLRGQELTQTQAAKYLGLPLSTLRSWARSCKLVPERRGRSLVYTPEMIEKAMALKRSPAPRR